MMQFHNAVFEGDTHKGGTYRKRAGTPNHTAVIESVVEAGFYRDFEQNPGPVKMSAYKLSDLVSGAVVFYRADKRHRGDIVWPEESR